MAAAAGRFKEPSMTTSSPNPGFLARWARLVVSISMQFEAGAQPERGAQGPFPPLDPRYPDLPVQKWFDYGIKEGIPRLLELWDAKGIKVTSPQTVAKGESGHPSLTRRLPRRPIGTLPLNFVPPLAERSHVANIYQPFEPQQ
jgi:hypothetical protein